MKLSIPPGFLSNGIDFDSETNTWRSEPVGISLDCPGCAALRAEVVEAEITQNEKLLAAWSEQKAENDRLRGLIRAWHIASQRHEQALDVLMEGRLDADELAGESAERLRAVTAALVAEAEK